MNEQRTSSESTEAKIANRLEVYKATSTRRHEQHRGGSYEEVNGRFLTGLPIPNDINPTDLMTRIKREQSEEMGQSYLLGRGFEFAQTATELLDRHGTVELMGEGLRRTLPPVKFEFNGGTGALHLVQGIDKDGESMGFTLDATLPGEYDETRIASVTDPEIPVIRYRSSLAMSKQADLVIGTLNYMKQQFEPGTTA